MHFSLFPHYVSPQKIVVQYFLSDSKRWLNEIVCLLSYSLFRLIYCNTFDEHSSESILIYCEC